MPLRSRASVALALHYIAVDGHGQDDPILMSKIFDERAFPLEVLLHLLLVFWSSCRLAALLVTSSVRGKLVLLMTPQLQNHVSVATRLWRRAQLACV